MHLEEKMEICSNFGWNYGILLIVNGVPISKGSLYLKWHGHKDIGEGERKISGSWWMRRRDMQPCAS